MFCFAGVYFLYYPPKHPRGVPWKEALRNLDWIGMALFVIGGTLYVTSTLLAASMLTWNKDSHRLSPHDHNAILGQTCGDLPCSWSLRCGTLWTLGKSGRAEIQRSISLMPAACVHQRQRQRYDCSFPGGIREYFQLIVWHAAY